MAIVKPTKPINSFRRLFSVGVRTRTHISLLGGEGARHRVGGAGAYARIPTGGTRATGRLYQTRLATQKRYSTPVFPNRATGAGKPGRITGYPVNFDIHNNT